LGELDYFRGLFMKVECPICGVIGHLQVRGQSARVGHCLGYDGRTRIVERHRINVHHLNLVINSLKSTAFSLNKSLRRDLDPRPLPSTKIMYLFREIQCVAYSTIALRIKDAIIYSSHMLSNKISGLKYRPVLR
jgi:hypothetical protein